MDEASSGTGGKAPPRLGSYRLIQPLGSGGMSSVFRAVHEESGHEVALKVLPRSLAKNPTLLHRFFREASSAEALEHPNIAAIYDRGSDQGRHYLVLEYVAGGDLQERVREVGPLPIDEAVRAIRSVAEGLDYALGRGVIHRDVKPANLLRNPAGDVKIIDLGLALQVESEDERVTRDGTTVGTVDYMAPEQARDSRATSERSDIYSLGCTFYFLLTGSPPYPGGNVPDKLGRHCTAPVPDPRDLRPETPEPLARLVRQMMAKKPEGRPQGYRALINTLDSLPTDDPSSPTALDVLVDDDDDDDDDAIGLEPMTLAPSNLTDPPPSTIRSRPVRESAPAEISLADLAAIEDDEPPARRGGRPPAAATANVFAPPPGDRPAIPRASSQDLPLSTWIGAGAALGLVIALTGFGVMRALSSADPEAVEPPAIVDEGQGAVPRAIVAEPPRPGRGVVDLVKPKPATPPAAPAWVEPVDPVVEPIAEARYSSEIEEASFPDWALRPPAAGVEAPTVTLRRIADPLDASDLSSLRSGLEKAVGPLEIADSGPFFEDDLRVEGKARILRARPGFRPMIKVEAANSGVLRNRTALIALDGARLTMEGIDLVVDVKDLPPTQVALFHLRNAELILRRCTVTILNSAQRPFPLIRVDDPGDTRAIRASLVFIDETLIRTQSPATFDWNGSADLAVRRSIVLAGGSVVVQRPSTARGDRRYFFARSLVGSRGPLLDLPGARAYQAQVRSLGSTFAKLAGVDGSSLIALRAEPSGPPSVALDWSGHDDAFVGWPSWLGVGEPRRELIANLATARATWPKLGTESREGRRGWPGSLLDDGSAAALIGLPETRPGTIGRVAVPWPALLDATAGTYDRPTVPEFARPQNPATRGGLRAISRADVPSIGSGLRPAELQRPAIGRRPPGRDARPGELNGDLTFDLADPTYRGDLGEFLRQRISPGVAKARVKVIGGGVRPMTPVRLPAGVAVEVASDAPPGSGPAFVPAAGSEAAALIESQGGDLTLIGITLCWSAMARVPRLVQVEDGHLLLVRSVLTSGDSAMPPGTGLILFRAAGTRPLANRAGPFLSPSDLPTCLIAQCALLNSGGEGVAAEVGRGLVAVEGSVFLSEGDGTSIALRPQKVARSRFRADLTLDRCSIAAERSVVQLGPWPGGDPGPDRPWLVSSNRSAFFAIAGRGPRNAVVLRSIGQGLAHGGLAWQGNGDGFEFSRFFASGLEPPPPVSKKPDIRADWVDFWGPRHVINVLGPNPRKGEGILTLAGRDRLRPGGLSVDDLRLDPKAHPDLGADLRNVPPASPGTPRAQQ